MAEETATTLSFELFPGRTLTLLPYHSVKNTQEVFQALMGSKLPGTGFLNPAYICSINQILAAANKTLFYEASKAMITKDLTTELLHTISAQRNIGLSLKEFGIRGDRHQFIAFIFDATAEKIDNIRSIVKGTAENLSSEAFTALKDEAMIAKHYKIEKAESELGSLETSVINRIVIRDI
jgi:tRNA threonylcarbamoyladenosine modification (KEOPS) complex Cgi121 subunit